MTNPRWRAIARARRLPRWAIKHIAKTRRSNRTRSRIAMTAVVPRANMRVMAYIDASLALIGGDP